MQDEVISDQKAHTNAKLQAEVSFQADVEFERNASLETKLTFESDVTFLGFALSECTVQVPVPSARYLRVVHRTALELCVQNRFGEEIGGFWLTPERIAQLRQLSDYYPLQEVTRAIEAYLHEQLEGFYEVQKLSPD